jgi:hypothetical protein
MKQQAEREPGSSAPGPRARGAIAGLTLNAIVFLVLASALHETWPIFVFAPSALLAITLATMAFGPRVQDR